MSPRHAVAAGLATIDGIHLDALPFEQWAGYFEKADDLIAQLATYGVELVHE